MKWEITIELWAYSGHTQEQTGNRVNKFEVMGFDFDTAFEKAKLIQKGCETNANVWKAPIMSITRAGHD